MNFYFNIFLGVWGDDIEIQAISELYDRPIEIYAYSIEPLKTFHENKDFNRMRNEEKNEKKEKKEEKINISYHGNCHYNSIISDNEELFYKTILRTNVGDYEDLAIGRLKRIKENKIAISQKSENILHNYNKNNVDINIKKNETKFSNIFYHLIFY